MRKVRKSFYFETVDLKKFQLKKFLRLKAGGKNILVMLYGYQSVQRLYTQYGIHSRFYIH